MSLAHLLPGRTYRCADPRGGARIRIRSFTPGGRQAVVVDARTGKRRRWILISYLHPTPFNSMGAVWRSGYILEEK